LSYDYRNGLATTVNPNGQMEKYGPSLIGLTRAQILDPNSSRTALNTYLVYDFSNFHAPVGNLANRFYLYMDGHVDTLVVSQ
jgi:hypothetical protein